MKKSGNPADLTSRPLPRLCRLPCGKAPPYRAVHYTPSPRLRRSVIDIGIVVSTVGIGASKAAWSAVMTYRGPSAPTKYSSSVQCTEHVVPLRMNEDGGGLLPVQFAVKPKLTVPPGAIVPSQDRFVTVTFPPF
jgi:hypothetical protein